MMGELSGLPAEAALERAHEVLFYVGLGEARYRKLGTYSLGMKQLAKLAQAIVHGPKLVILDEPTNGLDPPARQRMTRMIREMKETGDVRIILCSHLLRDVEETCEEVLILKQGRIVHYSNIEEERKANLRFVEIETHGDDAGFIAATGATGLRVRRLRRPAHQDGTVRRHGDPPNLPGCRSQQTSTPQTQLSPRHARRYLPESHGVPGNTDFSL